MSKKWIVNPDLEYTFIERIPLSEKQIYEQKIKKAEKQKKAITKAVNSDKNQPTKKRRM